MARQQRIDLAGYYHVINRGVEKREVFLDDEDFEKFLEIIKTYIPLYEFKLEAYCLMNNHYHILISTCKENISLIMKQINYTSYIPIDCSIFEEEYFSEKAHFSQYPV